MRFSFTIRPSTDHRSRLMLQAINSAMTGALCGRASVLDPIRKAKTL